MNSTIQQILKKSRLSVTESRGSILNLFINSDGALGHGEIEKQLDTGFDRVTIYRTLQTFVEKGIIHIIPSTDNVVRYALCAHGCGEGHHNDQHIHFTCKNCHLTLCLDHVATPSLQLPKGYIQLQTEVIVTGICEKCNLKNSRN